MPRQAENGTHCVIAFHREFHEGNLADRLRIAN
jgi:hypothetical protein